MEAVCSDKKLFGNKGNDIVSGGSLPHRKAAWFKKKKTHQPFANENVANAAKAQIDAFFDSSAKRKKKKNKRLFFLSARIISVCVLRLQCLLGRLWATCYRGGQTPARWLSFQNNLWTAWKLMPKHLLHFREMKFWLPKIKKEKWIWPALHWFSSLPVCGKFQTPAQLPFKRKLQLGQMMAQQLGLSDKYPLDATASKNLQVKQSLEF